MRFKPIIQNSSETIIKDLKYTIIKRGKDYITSAYLSNIGERLIGIRGSTHSKKLLNGKFKPIIQNSSETTNYIYHKGLKYSIIKRGKDYTPSDNVFIKYWIRTYLN